MIPTIEAITEGLLSGEYTKEQALGWIYEHMGLVREEGFGDLRDHFAGQALAGFCANPAIFAHNSQSGWELVNATKEQLAEECIRLADAMIAVRETGHEAD